MINAKIIGKTIKATIINIVIAVLITTAFFLTIRLFLGEEIDEAISLINMVAIDVGEKQVEDEPVMNEEQNRLKNYPEYGAQYARIKIPKIGVDLPVYYGETLEILKKGVGQSGGSYFPGEGGSIIYMGHNSANTFRRFSELQIGNEITVTTSYGEYTYKIYDMQIIKETEKDKLPIQSDKEILMVFTCYPFVNIGYTTQRYVVYAERVQ